MGHSAMVGCPIFCHMQEVIHFEKKPGLPRRSRSKTQWESKKCFVPVPPESQLCTSVLGHLIVQSFNNVSYPTLLSLKIFCGGGQALLKLDFSQGPS